MSAILGTVAFVMFGVATEKYKNKKRKSVLAEMEQIKKSKEESVEKKEKLMKNVRRLIFFGRIIKIYNEAFAVGASFVWESYIQMSLKEDWSDLSGLGNESEVLIVDLVYAAFIGFAFTELGLLLTDLREQRLNEAQQSRLSGK